jgi:hypothetical protein
MLYFIIAITFLILGYLIGISLSNAAWEDGLRRRELSRKIHGDFEAYLNKSHGREANAAPLAASSTRLS